MSEKKTRTRYPIELRQDVVRLVIEGGKKCADVAATHQVPVASVYAWVRHARVEEGVNESTGEPSVVALQADNARLRKELKLARDQALFLRKTAASFASEKKYSLRL